MHPYIEQTLTTLQNLFNTHPKENGFGGWLQHFVFSFQLGIMSIGSGLMFVTHSVFPFTLQTAGGDLLIHTTKKLQDMRHAHTHEDEDEEGEESVEDFE